MDSTSTPFSLKGSSEAFQARKDAVFGSFKEVALAGSSSSSDSANFKVPQPRGKKRSHSDQQQDMSQFKRSESIFKRPTPDKPPPRHKPYNANSRFNNRRNVPDYQRNPSKWKKYSLADVSDSDMSDRMNTRTALSFLKELEERKRQTEDKLDNNAENGSSKVIFKKRMARGEACIPEADNKGFVDGKLTMPTYEMGSGKRTPRCKIKAANLSDKIGKSPGLKLNHLEEDNDEVLDD